MNRCLVCPQLGHLTVPRRRGDEPLGLTHVPVVLQTFETEMLAKEENFAGLARLNREMIGRAEALSSPYRTVLDMDSTEIPVYRTA